MKLGTIFGLYLNTALAEIFINSLSRIKGFQKRLFKSLEGIWLKVFIIYTQII
jgi:hypothetical protein